MASKRPLRRDIAIFTIAAIFIPIGIAVGVGISKDNRATQPSPQTNTPSTPATSWTTNAPLPVGPWGGFTGDRHQLQPTYTVATFEDISLGWSMFKTRIVIPTGLSDTEIEFNARHAIDAIQDRHGLGSHINVFIYFQGDTADGSDPARHSFILAPGGEWGSAPGSAPLTVAQEF